MKPEDIKDLPEGWFTEADISTYRELIYSVPVGGNMLELGAWKGRSLCSVADLLIERNIRVFAVDTFDGTENEKSYRPEHKEADKIDVEKIFRDNIKRYKIDDRVQVIRDTTNKALEYFKPHLFDLIFIVICLIRQD